MVHNPEQLHFSNLVSGIKQEASECVIVAVIITEETSNGKIDSHLVPSIQVEGHNNSGTVLLILHILFSGASHHQIVHLQTGTSGQGVTRGTSIAVDSEGQTVDTGTRNSEDTGVQIVATSQVDEDMFIDNKPIITEGAIAG